MLIRVPVLVRRALDGQTGGGRVALVLAVTLTLLGSVLLVAGSLTTYGSSPASGAPQPVVAQDPSPTPSKAIKGRRTAKHPITPVRIEIPAIGADAPITPVSLDKRQSLQVPDPEEAGWWRQGAKPGARGVAVVVGHVDSKTGPAVFYHLSALKKGQRIVLSAADGSIVTYRVDSVQQYAKNAFPTRKVYGATKDAQLRLITCGGQYDRGRGGYRDNVVVFASLVRP